MTTCKIISLSEKKEEKAIDDSDVEVAEDFEATMKRNQANQERLRKERLNANKGVLRSYRIKQ